MDRTAARRTVEAMSCLRRLIPVALTVVVTFGVPVSAAAHEDPVSPAPPPASTPASPTNEAPSSSTASPQVEPPVTRGDASPRADVDRWQVIDVQAAYLLFALTATGVGAAFLLLTVGDRDRRIHRAARRSARWALAGLAVVGVVRALISTLSAANVVGITATSVAAGAATPKTASWLLVAATAGAAFAAVRHLPEPRVAYITAGAAGTALIAAASAGHVSVKAAPAFGIAILALHLIGAVAWAGPLLALAVAKATFRPAPGLLTPAVQAFSRLAAAAMLTCAATGVVLVRVIAGGVPTGTYAAALVTKVGILALVAGPLGVAHHLWARKRAAKLDEPVATATFAAEAAAAGLVLAAAVILAAVSP